MAASFSGDEVWVLRNGHLRTVSGWEHSSTKQNRSCAARVPGGAGGGVSRRSVL